MASVSEITHYCAARSCAKEANKRCSRCREVWYCSVACQTDHWSSHKTLCGKQVTVITADSKLTPQPKPCALVKHFAVVQSKWEQRAAIRFREWFKGQHKKSAVKSAEDPNSMLPLISALDKTLQHAPNSFSKEMGKIVDLGTGSLSNAEFLSEMTIKGSVVLVDNYPGFAEAMESLANKVTVVEDNIENLPRSAFPKDQSVKLFISLQTLNACLPSVELFQAIFDSLKPGGFFTFTLYDSNCVTESWCEERSCWAVPKFQQSVREFFEGSLGFKCLVCETEVFYSYSKLLILQKPL